MKLQISNDLLVLRPRDQATITKIFNSGDVFVFSQLTGDTNPIHLDEAYAAKTRFGRCIVHGKLIEGLISAIIGTVLPGPMSVFRSMSVDFLAPVYVGDEVTATVFVDRLVVGKDNWVILNVWAKTRDTMAVIGEAVISLPKNKLDFRID